tara:strand:- start:2011 stop:4173 length:2163 start_codon:yes stop_codon:yes gene_type:complete
MAKFKNTPTQVPAIPSVPVNVDPALKAWLQAAKESLEVRLGRRGDQRDRAVTLRELIESGLAKDLSNRPYDPNADISVDFIPFFQGPEDLAVPPKPTNLTASAGLTKIILTWTDGWTEFGNFSFTEVYRHSSNSLGDAIIIGTTQAGIFTDNVDPLTQYYYWVRHVSTTDVRGPFSDSANATAGQVSSTFLADNSVIAAKIADGTIAGTKFASGIKPVEVVSSLPSAGTQGRTVFLTSDNKLYRDTGSAWTSVVPTSDLTGTITNGQIADSAITAAKIGNDAVTTAKIADDAVTNALIATDAVNQDSIVANAVTASEIAAGTITTTQIASGTIVAGDIASGTITATQIAGSTITANQIASNTLTAGQIAAGAINASELAADAVTAGKIATGAIVAGDGVIGSAVIETAMIDNAAVTTAKIGNGQITTALIDDASITTAKVGTAAITNALIANAAIDTAKVASLYAQSISGDVSKVVAGSLASTVSYQNRSDTFSSAIVELGLAKPTHTNGWSPYAAYNINKVNTEKNSWMYVCLEMAAWNVNSVGGTSNETATNSSTPSAFGTGYDGAAITSTFLTGISGSHSTNLITVNQYVATEVAANDIVFVGGEERTVTANAVVSGSRLIAYSGSGFSGSPSSFSFKESVSSGNVGKYVKVAEIQWVAVDTAFNDFAISGTFSASGAAVTHGVKARVRMKGQSSGSDQGTLTINITDATGFLMGVR